MSIASTDLKLRQSERMTDFTDGGGRMSATEIVDGVMNNVFPDLSDADGIIGDVSLRKFFFQVDTDNTDTFLGPYVFLTDLPQNENVNVALFDTRSVTDERSDAQNYVESYRIKAVKTQLILYGLHSPGQRTAQVFCRSETPSPDIGDVLALSTEASGYTPDIQYVAVQSIMSRITTTFTDGSGDFERDVVIIQITTPLLYTFTGIEDPSRISQNNNAPAKVRFTQIADSAKYYGFKACTVAPEIGDSVVNVGDPYIAIVPAARGETPLVDQLAGLGSVSMIESSAANSLSLSFSAGSVAPGAVVTRYLGSAFARHTLYVTVGAVQLRDDGDGALAAVNPTDTGWSGDVDYQGGAFSVSRDVGFGGTVSVTATAAGAVVSQAYSRAIAITAATRGISYVAVIPGQPAAGTITVDYLALGKWIRLRDNGRGQISGNPGQGGGSVNYSTGSVALTLGALPDVDSAILIAWGTDLRAKDSHGDLTIPPPTYLQQLTNPGVAPGTLVITWTSGAASKTASADVSGAITGDAIGGVDHTRGVVEFSTALTPDSGEQFHYAYDYVDPSKVHSETFTPTAAGGAVSLTLSHAPVAERNVNAVWTYTRIFDAFGHPSYRSTMLARDDGAGGWLGGLSGTNTINYTTGAVVLTVE